MAMRAGLVALAPHVDLQRLEGTAREWDVVLVELLLETIHEGI